jgi:hypothetical protein
MTDRGVGLAGLFVGGNVRRLMYQTLIWPAVLGYDARSLGAALNAEDMKCLPDALIDRVGRNSELGGNFLGAQMLVDEPQAIELTRRQPIHAVRHRAISVVRRRLPSRVRQAVGTPQINPLAQHRATPEQRVFRSLGHRRLFRQNFRRISRNWLILH